MKTKKSKPTTVDEYIAGFSPEVQAILQKIRATVRKVAPDAIERISYQMPVFTWNGVLIYFGAFKKHIGLFPPVRDKDLRRETTKYAGEKGNLKFPLDEPIPYRLIGKIVNARLQENRDKLFAKKTKRQRT